MELKRDKISRSLKIDCVLNERLVALCDHLGVNPNAYLLVAVGKAISADEVAFLAKKQTQSMTSELIQFFQSMGGELAEIQERELNPKD